MRNVRELVDAINAGRKHTCSFRKIPSQASVPRWWVDLSMAAGNPVPNYYASEPLAAAVLDGTRGIFHGADKSPSRKYLSRFSIVGNSNNTAGQVKVLDYLLYYPFVDLDDNSGEQTMDNAVALPRYETGEGVMVMLVAVTPTVGGGSFFFNYLDQNGDPQVSPTISLSVAAANIASIATSEPATVAGGRLFLPLASGSTGVRSVTGVTVVSPGGGLGALVLVAPIADTAIRELGAPTETEFFTNRSVAPRIHDGAYLNMVTNCTTTILALVYVGSADFVWD